MLYNYLKIAFRNILTQKTASLVNILGLAIGISGFLIIFLYLLNEKSYDKHWEDSENIYRINSLIDFGTGASQFALTSYAMADTLRKINGIVKTTRIGVPQKITIQANNNIINIEEASIADSFFLEMFSYPIIESNGKKLLSQPSSVVLTEKIAQQLFGEQSAVGQKIISGKNTYTVCGVIGQATENTHLSFDMLISVNSLEQEKRTNMSQDWTWLWCYTYFKISENKEIESVTTDFFSTVGNRISQWLIDEKLNYKLNFKIIELTEIHLNTDFDYDFKGSTNVKYLYIFGIVSIFILLLACVNYINLATARNMKRAKEVGIRKVVGARFWQLMGQFLFESFFTVLIALILGLIFVEIWLPYLNKLMDGNLLFYNKVTGNVEAVVLVIVLFVWILVSVISGIVPAFIWSSYRPVDVLKGSFTTRLLIIKARKSSEIMRKLLVIFQFTVSICIISATLIVNSQMNYLRNTDLGFNKDQVMSIDIPTDTAVYNNLHLIENELIKNKNIIQISRTENLPGFKHGKFTFYIGDSLSNNQKLINFFMIDHDFDELLDLKIVAGRFFHKDSANDSRQAFVINEAAKALFEEPILGLKMYAGLGVSGKIIGVVKNFNYQSLHHNIEPLVLIYKPEHSRKRAIKIKSENMLQTIEFIRSVFKKYLNQTLNISFVDENFNIHYTKEEKMLTIFGYFSVLTILISCLGLFGLVVFVAEQRTKEIGIRKVLGASAKQIILLLTTDLARWILISNIIAFPIVYFAMNQWLNQFAFHTTIQLFSFVQAALYSAAIAFLTISIQVVRLAVKTPLQSLRYE